VRTINRNTEYLMFGSKESGLEVNVDKSKYIIMSQNKKCKKKSQYKN
jgi:ribosomal protein L30E